MDDAPTRLKEGPDAQVMNFAQLRAAVLRDLSALLNTSNLETIDDLQTTPLVRRSTLNYGIPGFAGLLQNASRSNTMERELAEAIKNFEPRIRSDTVRVRARGTTDAGSVPALVFEIEGELWAQPVPQHLFLETKIEIETRLATVTQTREAR